MKEIIMILSLIFLFGCASTVGKKVDDSKFNKIEIGKTTIEGVEFLLGKTIYISEDLNDFRKCIPIGEKKPIEIYSYTFAESTGFSTSKSKTHIIYIDKKTGIVCGKDIQELEYDIYKGFERK